MLKRAGRRLIVSPWFAAGAGVVIATGVVIYTPHASLNFGRAITVTPCKQAECGPLTPQGAGTPMPAGTGGQVTAPKSASMTVSYQLLDSQSWSGFSMSIRFRAPQSNSKWQLSFVIPGAQGVYVFGAPRWKRTGASGITVSSYQAAQDTIVQFQVRGTGNPRTPTSCSFNGAPCHFTRTSDPDAGSWPGSP